MPVARRVRYLFHHIEWGLPKRLEKLFNSPLLDKFFIDFDRDGHFNFDLNSRRHLYFLVEFDLGRNSDRYFFSHFCRHFNSSVDHDDRGDLYFCLVFFNNWNFFLIFFRIFYRFFDCNRYLDNSRPLLDRLNLVFFRFLVPLQHLHIAVDDLGGAPAHRVGTGAVGRPDTGACFEVAGAVCNW